MLSVSQRRCPWARHSPISNSGSPKFANKEDAVTIFVSVEAAHLPADIDRRSPLIAGSSQPGLETYAHVNVTENRNENPIARRRDCRRAGRRKPLARNGPGDETGEPGGTMEQNTSGHCPHPWRAAGNHPPHPQLCHLARGDI